MATILKSKDRDFQPNKNKVDNFRLFTDISRMKKNVNPEYLNFDVRQLNPGNTAQPIIFTDMQEELFMIISGSATLRTPKGLEVVGNGDIIFFEKGEAGAHQLYNHTQEVCIYLDIRTFIGYDVCEYPDSDKIIVVPNGETFRRSAQISYFDGEEGVKDIWDKLENSKDK